MITSFTNEHAFLSNFYPYTWSTSKRRWVRNDVGWDGLLYEGIFYPSSEHAYQAAKCLGMEDRRLISLVDDPGKIKKMGRTIKLRDGWDAIRISVMRDILSIKFGASRALKAKLLATGDHELIEGNWWNDRFWGVCRGSGENHLGKLLMEIRKDLAHV